MEVLPVHHREIDIPKVDLWDFLFERGDKEWPDDKIIYICPEEKRHYTYRTVRDAALRFGKGLSASWRLDKGDVISLFAFNNIDTPSILWGCLWAGLSVAPSSPLMNAREYAFQLKDSGAKGIVTQPALLTIATQAAELAGIAAERIILIVNAKDGARPNGHLTTAMISEKASGYSLPRKRCLKPDADMAFLCYSSGTTGHPKGVVLTHTNIIANILQNRACDSQHMTWHTDDVSDPRAKGNKAIGFLPFYHIYGLTCLVHVSLYAGLSLIVMPRFDLRKFCSHVQDFKVTFANVVPPVVLLLAKDPAVDEFDLRSLHMLNCGAAPLSKELASALYTRLRVPVKQGYGLTETSPTTHLQAWDRWHVGGSIGYLLPNQVATFVDEDGTAVPTGTTGELWIKGPNVFKGYYNNPRATKEAFSPDGFFKTGDIGHVDDKGNFFITDRAKELIKYKGFQVAPAELEDVLLGHPKVNDVAVIGVYDKEAASELPRAYIVPASGVKAGSKTKQEISDWLADRVSNYKRLRGGVHWVTEIPKSSTGKILRRVLKNEAKVRVNTVGKA
ncbi:acetyl-CoA synthetase-like protein [Pyrenochaeta sp. DS3sAY3a]|nr:acetyl-CoA synthetase-like protein [Pyrenochaeta sp. DS3sAY3a]